MGINIIDKTYLGYDDVFIIPQYSDVETRQQVSTKTILKGVHSKLDISLEVPVISANMDTITEHEMAICLAKQGAQGALHRFLTKEQNVEQYKLVQEAGQDCFVSIGVSIEDRERALLLFYAGARRFIVDIAHGHSLKMKETITWLRTNFGNEVFIVAGNVATNEAAFALECWGADAIKIFIGPGFCCTTKDVTGVTVPTFTCLEDCMSSGVKNLIADGGARSYGDIAKAIGLGAKAVMSGYFFAGCNEVPDVAKVVNHISGNQSFIYRGMASSDAMKILKKDKLPTPEGKLVEVSSKGSAEHVIKDIAGGLRSSMSYSNANNTTEFVSNVKFGRKR